MRVMIRSVDGMGRLPPGRAADPGSTDVFGHGQSRHDHVRTGRRRGRLVRRVRLVQDRIRLEPAVAIPDRRVGLGDGRGRRSGDAFGTARIFRRSSPVGRHRDPADDGRDGDQVSVSGQGSVVPAMTLVTLGRLGRLGRIDDNEG